MELDDLKSQLINKLATEQRRSDEDIAVLLGKRTMSITGKLKRSLRLELWISVAVVIFFGLAGIFSETHSFRIYFSSFAIMFVLLIVIFAALLQRVAKLSNTPLPIKSNLQSVVKIIEQLTPRYFQFTMALVPACFVFVLVLLYNENPDIYTGKRPVSSWFSSPSQLFVFLGAYFVVVMVGVYFSLKWYLRKLYSNYVTQLKVCIAELEEG